MLYATFLGVPFASIGTVVRDLRFLGTVLLVLLTPCIDYVIVFSGLAGGASARLLAAAPLLMLVQILLLPVYLLLFVGPGTVGLIELGPFLEAFLFLIVISLAAAALTQWWARHRRAGH